MEVLAAYLACAVLSLVGVRLGVPEAYHTICDHRHAACLRRTVALEIELGMREPPSLPAVPRPRSLSDVQRRWTEGVQSASVAYGTPDAEKQWRDQVKRWEAISRKNGGKPLSDDEALRQYYLTRR